MILYNRSVRGVAQDGVAALDLFLYSNKELLVIRNQDMKCYWKFIMQDFYDIGF